ncbi:hypothetical protein M514_04451 [Trichuris suis]|uniref:Uncharacterized protein n=1 Tax=Trichuris suis TaxID=68888 RepID=A0A085MC05_9BILA|nr:hypothetical protein M513_04451 [Trichuris suis]KFD62464.1 hypothetical protein M514_04451 [Trichuris suis]
MASKNFTTAKSHLRHCNTFSFRSRLGATEAHRRAYSVHDDAGHQFAHTSRMVCEPLKRDFGALVIAMFVKYMRSCRNIRNVYSCNPFKKTCHHSLFDPKPRVQVYYITLCNASRTQYTTITEPPGCPSDSHLDSL